jgi:tetratricopeptide (TPR) repeat protein
MLEISPLFAVEAEQLLMAGLIDEAYELCSAGLEEYPHYPSGYQILAKCLIEKNDIEKALNVTKNALTIFPSNKQIKQLYNDLKEAEEVIDKKELIEKSFNPDYSNSDISSNIITDDVKIEEIPEILSENIIEQEEDKELLEIVEFAESEIDEDIKIVEYEELSSEYKDIVEIAENNSENFLNENNTDIDSLENNELEDYEAEEEIIHYEDNEFKSQGAFLKLILHEEINQADFNHLKANNLELIPGLEYSPLKLMVSKVDKKVYIHELPEFPDFPVFEKIKQKEKSKNLFSMSKNDLPDEFIKNDPFAQLAQKLDNVKNPGKSNIKNDIEISDTNENEVVVSATLAKIYESQGAIEKAIEVYVALSDKEPEKTDFYLMKIEELQQKLEIK